MKFVRHGLTVSDAAATIQPDSNIFSFQETSCCHHA
jgi:hypothetical protein